MKALVDLSIDLDSKEVVELLISKLLPGALVERTGTPGFKQRVVGYHKEIKGCVILTTDGADSFGWYSLPPCDVVTIRGYEEARKVYERLETIAVSDDLADYIEEQVATMKPRTLDPLGSIFNLNDPRVVEALGTLLVGVSAEAEGFRGVIMEVDGLEAKLSTAGVPLSLTQSDPVEEEADADADDEPLTFNISELKVFKSY